MFKQLKIYRVIVHLEDGLQLPYFSLIIFRICILLMVHSVIAGEPDNESRTKITDGRKSTQANEVVTPYPTIRNLAVEWLIQGDENQNGVVGTPYIAKIGGVQFAEVEDHGIERIEINNIFRNVEFPNPPVPERDVPDLRPVRGSRVTDVGLRIPNINDDFSGNGPDCGAYESDQKLPHYGPRPKL